MVQWGVEIDGGRMYAFFAFDPAGIGADKWWTGTSGSDHIQFYPGVWIDTDLSDSTLVDGDAHQDEEWISR
jgi:hypothetical protein